MSSSRQLISILVMALLLACFIPGFASAKEDAPKVTIRVDGMGQDTVELAVNLLYGEYLQVELTAASGTGYEWKLVEDPRLSRVNKSEPVQLSADKDRPGGPYRITYTLQAGNESGTESIRFTLARPWETNKSPAKILMVDMTVIRR